jgi:hypothetical protein
LLGQRERDLIRERMTRTFLGLAGLTLPRIYHTMLEQRDITIEQTSQVSQV